MTIRTDGNRFQQQVQANTRPQGNPHTVAGEPPSTDSNSPPTTSPTQTESNQVRGELTNQPVFGETPVDFEQQMQAKQNMARANDIIGRLSGELSADDRTELSMELSRIIETGGLSDQQLLQIGNTVATHLRDTEGVDRSLSNILNQVLDKVDASAPDSNIMSLRQVMASAAASELAEMLSNNAGPAELIAKVNEFTTQLEGLDQQALTEIARDLGKLMAEHTKPVDSGLAPLLVDVLRRAESAPEREGFNFQIPDYDSPFYPMPVDPFQKDDNSKELSPEVVQQLQEALRNSETYDTAGEFLQQHIQNLREQEGSSPESSQLHQQVEEAQEALEAYTEELENQSEQLDSMMEEFNSIQEQANQADNPETLEEVRGQLESFQRQVSAIVQQNPGIGSSLEGLNAEQLMEWINQQLTEFFNRM